MAEDTQTLIDDARVGDREEVERRLTRDPGSVHARAANGDSPLLLAIYAGAPLHAAAVQGHADVVALLLASGADPDARAEGGSTPLLLAAAGGHVEVVESLLARGADPQARDAQGRSAAHHAADRGHAELASRLSAR